MEWHTLIMEIINIMFYDDLQINLDAKKIFISCDQSVSPTAFHRTSPAFYKIVEEISLFCYFSRILQGS